MKRLIAVDVSGNSEVELFEQKKVTARKRHICGECGLIISPGDKYERAKGVWVGGFECYKTCPVCAEIRDALFAETRDALFREYIFGRVWEDLGKADIELEMGDLLEFTPEAQRKIIDELVEVDD